ncbi:MAG: hypothetical protein JJE03_05460 [Peptostreptococcaceae bacterium]|nr:hypothetical protein [Peptostreptococcaceae bacterium]
MDTFEEKRMSSRANLNKRYKCNKPKGLEVEVHDINRDYLTVKCELDPPGRIEVEMVNGVVLECEYEKDIHDRLVMYKVNNLDKESREKVLTELLAGNNK